MGDVEYETLDYVTSKLGLLLRVRKVRNFHLVLFLMDSDSNNFEEIDEADVQISILLVLGLSTMTAYFRLLVAVLRLLQNH